MEIKSMFAGILPYLPNIIFIFVVFLAAVFANKLTEKIYFYLIKKYGMKPSQFGKYAIKTTIYLLATIMILMNIPGIQGSMIQLVGLIAGGIVAFSSSSIIANGMSGVLIKSLKQYTINDVIEFEGDIGRVTEISLFHTEIQTPKRKLLTIPNSVMMTNKFTNLSETGTIVSAEVGLGYDLPRPTVEKVLLKTARTVGLEHPYVSVTKLGDYAVTYEINGLLKDVGGIIGAQSQLKKEILDEMSQADIEIVSPAFRNVRMLDAKKRFVPKYVAEETTAEIKQQGRQLEHLMFQKAEKEFAEHKKEETESKQLQKLVTQEENLEEAIKKIKSKRLREQLIRKKEAIQNRIDLMNKNLEEQKKREVKVEEAKAVHS
jgi:small conductance mechanosensitive channel